jgi:hypothetical protein
MLYPFLFVSYLTTLSVIKLQLRIEGCYVKNELGSILKEAFVV